MKEIKNTGNQLSSQKKQTNSNRLRAQMNDNVNQAAYRQSKTARQLNNVVLCLINNHYQIT